MEALLGFVVFKEIQHYGEESIESDHLRNWYPTKIIFVLLILSNMN